MSKRELAFFSFLSGGLLSLSWIEGSTGLFLFIAFLPLLHIENYFFKNRDKYKSGAFLKWAFLTMLFWNFFTTWWIKNASVSGMVIAFLVNSVQFSFVLWLFHVTRRKTGSSFGYFALIVYWITYEHFYLNAEISWPWLTLGYGFAENIRLIQWYELTGSLGGSLWTLLINILIFNALISFKARKNIKSITIHLVALGLIIFVPIGWSYWRFNNYVEDGQSVDVVVIQPNVDPYEKFIAEDPFEQTKLLVELASEKADTNVDYFVAPETAINNNIWLDKFDRSRDLRYVRQFISRYPKSKFIVGITAYQRYEESNKTATSKPLGDSPYYYDSFNSAIQIDTTDTIQFYHKSQLVVGVEKMPYPQYLNFLRKLTLKLGGTFRSHGTQKERSNLISTDSLYTVAPIICYESVFGEYVTDYVNKGANLLFIITNDGWWGDTPGHRQHKTYAQLRAIETRRSVARSANTGISCFVNQKGEVSQELGWWEKGVLRETLYTNDDRSFYSVHGDYIARVTQFFALLCILYLFVQIIIRKRGDRGL